MSAKKVLIASAVALSALAGTVGAANAGHRHHGFHKHHRFHFYAGPVYRDCSFYREMWEDTGRFKWKRRYYECKGWW